MHLEISGRQTGKTRRLAKAVVDFILPSTGNIANVVVTQESDAKIIKNYIKEILAFSSPSDTPNHFDPQVRFTTPERKNAIIRGYGNVRNFYDDFDFMEFNWKKDGTFFYTTIENDYYVTTPAKIRDLSKISIQQAAKDDFLLRLLLENHGMYVSFVNPNSDPAWTEAMKRNMEVDTFDREMNGKFLKH